MKTLFCRQKVGLSFWAPPSGILKTIVMALMLAFGLQVLGASDPQAVLAAKKVPFEQEIEEQCLKRFFSASCLDDIRAEHLREMRGFDLRREAALQAMRDIDAKARADTREERIRARDDKAKERRGS